MKKILSMLFIALTLIVNTNAQTTQTSAQYALDRIDQRSGTLSGTYTYDFDGSGISIFLGGSWLLTSHTEFGSRASNPIPIAPNWGPDEHSTEVAGFAGSNTYGVAKGSPLMGIDMNNIPPVFVGGEISKLVPWLHNNVTPPAVVELSGLYWCGEAYCQNPTYKALVQSSIDEGFVWVYSAGNDHSDIVCGQDFPEDMIIVGSMQSGSNSEDEKTYHSNYGSCVDIYAPLGGTTPTVLFTTSGISTTATTNVTGTSFAAPLVAGAAAQVLQQYPNFTPQQVKQLLIDRSTKNTITNLPLYSNNRILYTRETYISGKVTNPNGIALNNTNVELLDSSFNVIAETYTSSFGLYSFRELVPYNTYYVRPVSKRWRFTTQQFTNLTETLTNADFEGTE